MAQITTYGRGSKTEAQKRADAERAKERGQAAESERRETLQSAGKGLLEKAAIELALEAEANIAPPDAKAIAAEKRKLAAAKRKDKARFAELVEEFEANRDRQYEGLTMMFDAIFSDMELSLEALGLAKKIGVNNPLELGTMMNIQDGLSGVPQNKMHLVERICDRIKDRYRSAGGHFNRAEFERPVI